MENLETHGIIEPVRAEIRQNWTKGHEWAFVLDRDKLAMNAVEKGNHFHNDIPLDQIDPYESEEKFFLLRWPIHLLRGGVVVCLGAAYGFTVLMILGQTRWSLLAASAAGLLAAAFGFAWHAQHHRTLLRFYHRMTGMELFALFKDLPDKDGFDSFLASLKQEIPPWSSTFGGPSKTENMARELKALHQLRKDEILTDKEFLFKKHELLTDYFHHGQETKI